MWLTMILRNWQVVVIGLLGFALTLSTLYGRVLKAELGEKTAVIEYMQREAETFAERSDQIAKETNSAFTQLVDQIKDKELALKNAKARFGACNAAGGITAVRLPNVPGSVGQADSASGPYDTREERVAVSAEFINDCAIDAGQLEAWRSWAVKNGLPTD